MREKGLYIRKELITNTTELLRFSNLQYTFYRITYTNGYTECLENKDVYITRTPINQCNGKTWDYLRKVADEIGLQVDGIKNILSKQYDLVDTKRDNVPLAQFLGNKIKLATYRRPKQIYYPFGCNSSQKNAVEAALTQQVSIIQGPPGTGKTQTILNIIANLLLARKTILVVSNNNSAVENIAEKLDQEGLGFLVAQLGSRSNKEKFISRQMICYPDISDWEIENPSVIKQVAKESLHTLSQSFCLQTKFALQKAKYDALMAEQHYNDLLKDSTPKRSDWLNRKHSAQLMRLLVIIRIMEEEEKKPSFWFRMKWSFVLGFRTLSFLQDNLSQVVTYLEYAYYHALKVEYEVELKNISEQLQAIDLKQKYEALSSSSLQIVKSKIAKWYKGGMRQRFSLEDIKAKTKDFLTEYPIVLSTTYSAKSCVSEEMVFDYLIMDEASQVDITTGALALSCAINAVIVGDNKQLPNVVTQKQALVLNTLQSAYQVDDRYNITTHSFLQSCTEIFKEAPSTLLKEHYRCHPKIIEFCNKQFYNGELIPMTIDSGEEMVIQVIQTAKGNHAHGHYNQREVETIVQEVMPQYPNKNSIGIITPYREQALNINEALGRNIASTVHKYQGRECNTIIVSTVDNTPTAFSDNANLLNVAISRAKSHLCIVTTGNEIPEETNLAQLVAYIRYNNFEVKESSLHSVFDLLYQQYTTERLSYQAKLQKGSEHLSENLFYDVLIKAINSLEINNLSTICHYPLYKLIADWSLLNEQEYTFAKSSHAHVDFLIYNTLTKRPLLTIEIDGWSFHKNNIVQQARDSLKDRTLAKYALTPLRLSTTDTITIEKIRIMLEQSLIGKQRTAKH